MYYNEFDQFLWNFPLATALANYDGHFEFIKFQTFLTGGR